MIDLFSVGHDNLYMAQKNFIEERRNKVLDYINQNSRADIAELAQLLDCTEATIRRDLDYLEQKDLLIRTHGGAIRKEKSRSVWQTTPVSERLEQNSREKRLIAEYAANLIDEGESLMIDGGSTTMFFANSIRYKNNLQIITNAPAIAEILVESENNNVIVTGGEMLRGTYALGGSETEKQLEKFYVDKCVIGVTGLIIGEGVFAAIPTEANIKRIMAMRAREIIILMDSSKIGTRGFCRAFKLHSGIAIITDSKIAQKDYEALRNDGVNVLIAESKSSNYKDAMND